ncbi:helix-turn-helix domain-containing protein [Bacteroides cellulosilyticus]|uniref:helix-turn-helix domain-containing protein n=1 Tax=Bacteroides cellulosilyticus TaxID=246787 RepID=UPI00189EE1F1|nr:helix-turn-helix domain-containing protein [Bacteroides cellulosilyticus]
MDLITKDSETTQVLFSSLDRVLENVEHIVTNYRPVLNGEHYLTGEEVCQRLCISKRTLQDYRDTELLGYVQLPGKIIYRESDIMELLDRHYRK